MFHVNEHFVKSTSSIGAVKKEKPQQSILILMLISGISCLLVLVLLIKQAGNDPYIERTLNLKGSIDNGSSLFRMNCVGCHGITAQGLVGPDLNKVTEELSDTKIIIQVVKGLTPPMPSFEIDSQSMADLLSYLHSLND